MRITAGRWGVVLAVVLFAVWAVGQIARDRWHITGIFFYVPSPAVAVMLGVGALMLWRLTCRRAARLVAVLALVPLAVVLCVENQWARPAAAAGSTAQYRLVHWNVMNGWRDWPSVERALLDAEADLVVLSEPPSERRLDHFLEQLPAGVTHVTTPSLFVAARGQLSLVRDLSQGDVTAQLISWQVDHRALSLLVVDLPSKLHYDRDPLLAEVRRRIARHRPDLVVGDFNAPRRSRQFDSLPRGYAHAYDLAGSGWSYTWPVPVPVLAIDQCIAGPRISAVVYQLRSTVVSDHRMQVLDFSTRSEPATGEKR